MANRVKKTLYIAAITAASAYVSVCAYYYFMQESLLFKKAPLEAGRLQYLSANYPEAKKVAIYAPDGTGLKGWIIDGPKQINNPLLIFFCGNADEASDFIPHAVKHIKGWSMLFLNYRGYGQSAGRAGQDELFADSEFIFDSFSNDPGIDGSRIAVLGRSLGTGVAVHLASVRHVAGVILISPYESISDVAREMYPYLPVSALLRHPFDSKSKSALINAPVLGFAAPSDKVIPIGQTRRFMSGLGTAHKILEIDSKDHNSLAFEDRLWEDTAEFLSSLANPLSR